MAALVPTYQDLTTVDAFRKLVNETYSKQINEGQVFDARDLQRFNEVDEYIRMYIQHGQYGKTFDEKKALQIFHDAMVWRKQNNVFDISTSAFPANYFDRHVIFFKNHDLHGSPILNALIRKYNKGQDDSEAIKRFLIYNFEEHIRANPGQRIVILFDMSNTGLRILDYDLVKFIMNALITYYPGLLAYMLIYKLPFILQAAWKIIKGWLSTETQKTVIFVDEKTITNYVSPDQITPEIGANDTS